MADWKNDVKILADQLREQQKNKASYMSRYVGVTNPTQKSI